MIDKGKIDKVKYEALKFLKSQATMVIASVSGNLEPQAALVYFVSDENFNLFFMTPKKSSKAENIKDNGRVAFVAGFGPKVITVQGGGVAKELSRKEAETFYGLIKKTAIETSHQWPILHLAKEGYHTFKVTPQWMTYLNMEKETYPEIASEKFHKII